MNRINSKLKNLFMRLIHLFYGHLILLNYKIFKNMKNIIAIAI